MDVLYTGVRAARCFVAQGVPVERGVADWEVTRSHTHAWEWQAHACVTSRSGVLHFFLMYFKG
jgi:hypothetical protein